MPTWKDRRRVEKEEEIERVEEKSSKTRVWRFVSPFIVVQYYKEAPRAKICRFVSPIIVLQYYNGRHPNGHGLGPVIVLQYYNRHTRISFCRLLNADYSIAIL